MPDVKPSLDGFLHLDAITIDVWHLAQQAMQGKAEAGLHAVQSGQSQNGGKLEDIWDPGVAFWNTEALLPLYSRQPAALQDRGWISLARHQS